MNSVGELHLNLFQQVCILADCGFNHRASFKIHRFGFVHSTDWNPWLLFSNRMNSVREQHQNLFQQVWFLTDCGFNHRASFIIHRFGFVHTTDWNPWILSSNWMNSVGVLLLVHCNYCRDEGSENKTSCGKLVNSPILHPYRSIKSSWGFLLRQVQRTFWFRIHHLLIPFSEFSFSLSASHHWLGSIHHGLKSMVTQVQTEWIRLAAVFGALQLL